MRNGDQVICHGRGGERVEGSSRDGTACSATDNARILRRGRASAFVDDLPADQRRAHLPGTSRPRNGVFLPWLRSARALDRPVRRGVEHADIRRVADSEMAGIDAEHPAGCA